MKKKIVALVMCMVLLVAVSITGTLAYLTSNDTVTNTFTVGHVKITMDESKVDANGAIITGQNAGKTQENTYKLLPGGTYAKDPVIHVASGSEPCYLVVYVDNQLTGIETATSDGTIATQMATNGWKQGSTGYENYWYYIGTGTDAANLVGVAENNNVDLFKRFAVNSGAYYNDTKVNGVLTDTNALNLAKYDGQKIIVKAFAIQADNIASTAIDTVLAQAAGVLNPTSAPAGGGE